MAITRSQINKSVHEGVRIANDKYEKLTGGDWLKDAGVEEFMRSEIVARLRKRVSRSETVFPELSFKYIREWSEFSRRRGRPFQEANDEYCVDICLVSREGRPKYVMEMKRFWNERECLRDLNKIRGLVRTYPAIECGFFAVFLAHPMPDGGVSGRIEEVAEFVRREFENRGVDINFRHGRTSKRRTTRRVWEVSSLSIEVSARR